MYVYNRTNAMSSSEHHTKEDLLDEISKWSTDDIVALLEKNNLADCCATIIKRQINGEGFLHLTEGHLRLWKSDLTITLRGSLYQFLEELKNNPIKYFQLKKGRTSEQPKKDMDFNTGESDDWDTDFDDDDYSIPVNGRFPRSPQNEIYSNSIDSVATSEINCYPKNSKIYSKALPPVVGKKPSYLKNEDEKLNENLYANGLEVRKNSTERLPAVNSSVRNNFLTMDKKESCLVQEFQEKFKLNSAKKKAKIEPKPKVFKKNPKIEKPQNISEQQKATLKINSSELILSEPKIKKPDKSLPIPPKSKETDIFRNILKPPTNPLLNIGQLDLSVDIPSNVDDSDDYEPINQLNFKFMNRVNSTSPLGSNRSQMSSINSVYHPKSDDSVKEDQDNTYSIINETLQNNMENLDECVLPKLNRNPQIAPRPLPDTPAPVPTLAPKGRSPDKKFHTSPNSGSQSSLNGRHTRPLPPTPTHLPECKKTERAIEIPERKVDGASYTEKPWFHNVSREKAIALVEGEEFRTNPPDGYFLFRPSGRISNHPFTLVLWYNHRTYNIAVRKSHDSRYALGSVKPDERWFESIEEIVSFHQQKELVLYTGGVKTGSTRLTETPPKKND